MYNSFKLTLVQPAIMQRLGKLASAIEIATSVEDAISFEDGSYLVMSIQETRDSSYARLKGFYFPILITVTRMTGEQESKRISRASMAFWQKNDGHCLVMLRYTNKPADNPECNYQEAIAKIIETLKAELAR